MELRQELSRHTSVGGIAVVMETSLSCLAITQLSRSSVTLRGGNVENVVRNNVFSYYKQARAGAKSTYTVSTVVCILFALRCV